MADIRTCGHCGQAYTDEPPCPFCYYREGGYIAVMRAKEEAEALERRYQEARDRVPEEERDRLDAFEDFCARTRVVIGCSMARVLHLVEDRGFYASHYEMVDSRMKQPRDNHYDDSRDQVDGKLFGRAKKEIRFGLLSANGLGDPYYGKLFLELETEPWIAHRTAVFEKNSFHFCEDAEVSLTGAVPPGARAVWSQRAKLCVAKLVDRLLKQADARDDAAFQDVLLPSWQEGPERDFVEVHIHGGFAACAVARISAMVPKDERGRKRMKNRVETLRGALEDAGIPAETLVEVCS